MLIEKKTKDARKRPGTKEERPRNSRLKPCHNQRAWPRTQRTAADMPSVGLRISDEVGRYNGRRIRYQRKY
jgi:hypothetical protein